MSKREDLQTLFEVIVGSKNVYYQPPEGISIKYPCIVYDRSNIKNTHADNIPYTQVIEYEVTVIDKNPESFIVVEVSKLPTCQYNRGFKSANLNHTVFKLKY